MKLLRAKYITIISQKSLVTLARLINKNKNLQKIHNKLL